MIDSVDFSDRFSDTPKSSCRSSTMTRRKNDVSWRLTNGVFDCTERKAETCDIFTFSDHKSSAFLLSTRYEGRLQVGFRDMKNI